MPVTMNNAPTKLRVHVQAPDDASITHGVVLDGAVQHSCHSLDEAQRHATWLRRHPARLDRVLHGHGGHVVVGILVGDVDDGEVELFALDGTTSLGEVAA